MAKIDLDEACPCESGKLYRDCHITAVIQRTLPKIEEEICLKVIPEPDPNTRTVFEKTSKGTVLFQGYDIGVALCCEKCRSHLTQGIARTQLLGIVIRCNSCGAFNEV
ncbi:SEC-C metal-binding domain-containing protein [Pseudomonas sp. PS01301]|uniref:SEC-C metal-binding domain-containing protein n=1 Tax=Pseudomonas sp. PS01301 TaxID=2991437 RepID=UPI00249B9437|nr:SEC-C metal-binding domain-containing protein [Pseudomonas sp. PS01301]